ncbi:hypothetical protein C5167_018048 [Papaver somniferum]|uniref:Cytochrome P450 n=1 Tax=Papaver somniferum TaxID=3469 RepID=A0A4Y7IL45_PAPSO|nr:hypothetical protein C5167_018048 [Papaver somniferum]
MEGIQWIILSILVGALMILCKSWFTKTMELPPGPRKLPVIGNLHQLNKGGELVHVTLAKMAQQHGKIMTVWFGGQQPSIVVSHHDAAWEVLVTKASDFSSRTLPYMSKFSSADWYTLATCNLGPFWQNLRKGLQTTTLNPHTFSAQVHLQEKDISNLILDLKEEASLNGGIVKPMIPLRRTTIQLIGRFCFGAEFEDKDGFVENIDTVMEETIRLSGHARLVDVFEFTRYIPGFRLLFKEAYELKRKIEETIRPYIRRYKSSTNCFLQFLLSQEDYSEEVVIFNLFEQFLLSTDSTSNTTSWALAYLIHNEKIQEKVYEEVQELTRSGRSREEMVTIEEVSKLKYVNAAVKEVLRMKPIAPLAVPHQAVCDSNLMGMKVRKGTPVMVNIYAVHYDPTVWVEPERFMPERFLSKPDVAMERSLIVFGAGRRICAGMDLAKLQVALTLANLVNSFRWSCVSEGQLPDLHKRVLEYDYYY